MLTLLHWKPTYKQLAVRRPLGLVCCTGLPAATQQPACLPRTCSWAVRCLASRRFFYFFIFQFRFLQKYIFVFEIYRNISRPPRCRATRTWSPRCGAAGAFVQKLLRKYLCAGPWGRSPGLPVARPAGPPSRPAAGRPALAARLQGDRLSHPYIRVGWSPHPSFASLKFQKPRKKERGRERGEALPDF